MKRILLVGVFLMSTATISAQEPIHQTYTEPKHEVAIAYGILPASDFLDMFTRIFDDIMTTNRCTGTASLSYTFKLNETVGLGGTFAFAGYSGNAIAHDNGLTYKNFYTILPQAKFNWYRSRNVTLYSRAAVGVTFAALRERYDVPENPEYSKTKAAFAWQLSPIGVEVGRAFAVYAEAGFGAIGSAVFGLRCRF